MRETRSSSAAKTLTKFAELCLSCLQLILWLAGRLSISNTNSHTPQTRSFPVPEDQGYALGRYATPNRHLDQDHPDLLLRAPLGFAPAHASPASAEEANIARMKEILDSLEAKLQSPSRT